MTIGKRFNINQELEKLFIEVPQALLYEPKYKANKELNRKALSNTAKLLYGILLERTKLSVYSATVKGDTTYIDKNGDIFIFFDDTAIAEILNVSPKTGRSFKKELIEFDLLEEVRIGQGCANRLYLNIVEVDAENLRLYRNDFIQTVSDKKETEKLRVDKYRKENAETVENTLNGKNDRTRTVKSTVLVQSKLPSSNKELSNTDFSNTELKKSVVVINGVEKEITKSYEIQLDENITPEEKIDKLNKIHPMNEHTKALMDKFIEFGILVSESQIKMLNNCVYDVALKSIDYTIAKDGKTFSYFYEIYKAKEKEDIAAICNFDMEW
ncbi:replication initiator protein A [Paraclostridium sp. AKS81]|uniref:replication initiator protein A n=1 Tax=Paraclostridium sp. AKS81 TaxID=2876117 RepID=UPI0021E06228|nr:replication initiator protein A [Paraclostridium sp. AKS81]MCU9811171.1 replication initiator protein A [Paraclostridium sp. AKS81]